MQPKVLVIGSKDHDRASCLDWLQQFPNIEEYYSVIMNMQSLTQDTYNKIYDKIFRLREQITTLFTTNREIFCIMDKVLHSSSNIYMVNGSVHSYNSYDWIPVNIKVNKKNGTSRNLYDHRFDKYFELVEKWDYELELDYGSNLGDLIHSLFCQVKPIALNVSKKTIAGSLRRVNPLSGQIFEGISKQDGTNSNIDLIGQESIDLNLHESNSFSGNVAGGVGFEPTTTNLGGWCSVRTELR